jgi:hypothetical protein
MMILPLMAATLSVSLIGLAILCVVATRNPAYAPASGTFFTPPLPADPHADTLAGHCSDSTLAGDWKAVECCSLADAEEMLDVLEARNVQFREFEVVSNDRFVVRYR